MFAKYTRARARRRGIVLVLILGMLGLLALIGVTFATFAGQSLVNARNFNLSENRPNAEQYMDFALAQLINDTNNPLSALRGHSLLRDMYGNDSVQRGTTGAEIRGFLDRVTANNGQLSSLYFTGTQTYSTNNSSPFTGMTQYITNIPTANLSYQYYGLNFTRWILRLTAPGSVAQTFEVLEDDDISGNYHVLTLSPNDSTTGIYVNAGVNGGNPYVGTPVGLATVATNNTHSFTLDGRYMRAFNGPGMSRSLVAYALANTTMPVGGPNVCAYPLVPFNVAAFANFRTNGGYVNTNFPANNIVPGAGATGDPGAIPGDPDAIGMDEDYDACDLENWFLAIQSADGQVVIPSFHRPGILTAGDWQTALNPSSPTAAAIAGVSKILRPRSVDHSPGFGSRAPDPSTPDASGKITYDIDNDGDGVTDSIWLDLGYPVQKDPGGKLFKPLFSFMVIGQNGRLPLNTVGNIQSRDFQTTKQYNMAQQVVAGVPSPFYTYPQVWYDAPTWDHASHLGYSVNEINPKYALQNAPANVYSTNFTSVNTSSTYPLGPVLSDTQFSQIDNSGMDVSLTQLRNLLTGTVPQDKLINPAGLVYDANWVYVGGQLYYMPNGVIDANDTVSNSTVARTGVPPVPGRWGEVEGVPTLLYIPNVFSNIFAANSNPPAPSTTSIFANPVRAGRSFYSAHLGNSNFYAFNSSLPTGDGNDDDLDAAAPQFYAAISEYGPVLDGAGQYALASQRMQRFVNPVDPTGTGRLVGFMERPAEVTDYGRGYDSNGRVGFFRHFRPPGVPAEIDYPVAGIVADAFKMGVYSYYRGSSITSAIPNRSNNRYHGFEGFRAPTTHRAGPYGPWAPASGTTAPTLDTTGVGGVNTALIAVMGAAPYDYVGDYVLTTVGGVTTATDTPQPVTGNSTLPNVQFTYGAYTQPVPAMPYVLNGFSTPTMSGSVNSESGPYLMGYSNTVTGGTNPSTTSTNNATGPYQVLLDQAPTSGGVSYAQVVNGYPLGSLNKDEADEMNVYNPNNYDQQFGPSDLEWLYRKQDVDGSTLTSRLEKLAPISFMNPVDALTRRRLFSLESWEPNSFVYANDNPQGAFPTNSRFGKFASANLAAINQVATDPQSGTTDPEYFANAFATEALFNPTLASPINSYIANPKATAVGLPVLLTDESGASTHYFQNSTPATQLSSAHHADYFARPNPTANTIAYPTLTPSIAHRDRRINLNFPFPVASDPAEPVRQKWIRETYQLLKTTLPPQSVDTPQELAALSQYVVNIVDFRDPDCTTTRFVNTDLMVVPPVPAAGPTPATPSGVQFATMAFPGTANSSYTKLPHDNTPPWDPNSSNGGTPIPHTFTPFDPYIAWEQTAPSSAANSDWIAATTVGSVQQPPYLVQYGMEHNPIALNEVLCYSFNPQPTGGPPQVTRFYIELVNTLTDENTHAIGTNGSADLDLKGWDFVIMPDSDPLSRPDPITGCIMANVGGVAMPAPSVAASIAPGNMNPPDPANPGQTLPGGTATLTTTMGNFPLTAIGWGLGGIGLRNAAGAVNRVPPIRSTGTGNPTPTYYVMGNQIANTSISGPDPVPLVAFSSLGAQMPTGFLPSTTVPTAGSGNFYWLYLRRPANPFNETGEMVVVDSVRFPWAADNGNGISVANAQANTGPTGNPPVSTQTTTSFNTVTNTKAMASPVGSVPLFSAQRQQPYKGGQLVTSPYPNPPFAYGYSDQMIPGTASPVPVGLPSTTTGATYGAGYWVYQSSKVTTTSGVAGAPAVTNIAVPITKKIYESLGGAPNNNADPYWDYFPFHDRDFTSVAELMMVPGCPPGLFTKQFAEAPYSDGATVGTPLAASILVASGTQPTQSPRFTGGVPHAYPYLVDKFFYTAASVANDINDKTTPSVYPAQIGGWTGTGWHKMFDFFEVPSSANGAIGTAANGENFDWARADRRPGLINLNLIMDEEVFFGVLDDPRLNLALAQYYTGITTVLPQIVTQVDPNGFPVNVDYLGNHLSSPAGSYSMSDPTLNSTTYLAAGQSYLTANNPMTPLSPTKVVVGRGFSYGDPTTAGLGVNTNTGINYNTGFNQTTINGMKGAFIDFLKLRHGGSNFLFAHGSGIVQDGIDVPNYLNATAEFSVPEDRTYHSLSYPDINYTIMRPAYLPPSKTINLMQVHSTTPPPNPPVLTAADKPNLYQYYGVGGVNNTPVTDPTALTRVLDLGVRLPWLDTNFYLPTAANDQGTITVTMPSVPQIPPIPPRRLFQLPDYYYGTNSSAPPLNAIAPSNAGITGDLNLSLVNPNFNLTYRTGTTQSTLPYNTLNTQGGNSLFPFEAIYSAAPYPANVATLPAMAPFVPTGTNLPTTVNPATGNPYSQSPFLTQNYFLGANSSTVGPPTFDRRQHPYYRTEILQKMMNLTTVRTHQFAVWITVGFFEVTHAGVPELGQPDVLGGELDVASGHPVRIRSFFVIDRTKATGFNPYYPGEFRDCVTYRRRIQ